MKRNHAVMKSEKVDPVWAMIDKIQRTVPTYSAVQIFAVRDKIHVPTYAAAIVRKEDGRVFQSSLFATLHAALANLLAQLPGEEEKIKVDKIVEIVGEKAKGSENHDNESIKGEQ